MEIICSSCQGKLKIADEKLPAGKAVNLKCPRCGTLNNVKAQESLKPQPVVPPAPAVPNTEARFDDLFDFIEEESDSYDASEKPFDFIEEEGKSALLCELGPEIRSKIKPSLDIMEYHVTEVPGSREALKKMRFHRYDLLVINEFFDSRDPDANPILIYLERMPMENRRDTYVVLLTSRFRTMDNMCAFQKSVNMILNLRNIDDFGKILQRGLADYGLFYKVFKETMSGR